MKLGISSLGHIIEFGLSGKFKNLIDLLLEATEACLNFSEERSLKICELVLDPPVIFSSENKQKFIDLVKSYSIKKQIHGPFVDVNLCSHNNSISKASVESYIETAKICDEINSKIMTIHPGLANFMISSIHEYNKIQLKEAVNKILDFTSKKNLIICLENMPKKAYIMLDDKNIEEIFNLINREDLYLTFDTSHYYTNDGNVGKLWEKFHEKIRNVHIVDNFSKKTDTHPPLGTGKVDFERIFTIMKEFDYRESIIIELSSYKKLNESIEFINRYL